MRSGAIQDPKTRKRWLADENIDGNGLLHYTMNTAFKDILTNSKRSYYMSNNLFLLSRFRLYENQNKNWRKFYNATLVVPITLEEDAELIGRNNVVGFLCVDNKKGRFDSNVCVIAAQIFAKIGCGVIIALGRADLRTAGAWGNHAERRA